MTINRRASSNGLCSAFLLAAVVTTGCSSPASTTTASPSATAAAPSASGTIDLQIVRAFFATLDENRYTISRSDLRSDRRHDHVFRWVLNALPPSATKHHEFQELRFSKATVATDSAYELKMHRAKGFADLLPERAYIQLHAVHVASDPEFHGVIDGDTLQLLSFWGDGA